MASTRGEITTRRVSKQGMGGPRIMDSRKFAEDRVPDQVGPSTPKQYLATLLAPKGCRSLPQDSSFKPNVLQHQRSTKQLISRYEAMTPDSRHSVAKPSDRSTRGLSPPKTFASPFKGKGTSPIRQSFRNLLSVFKKGKVVGTEKDNVTIIPTQFADLDFNALATFSPKHADPMAVDSRKPLALHSGPLLYLSRSSPPPSNSVSLILPVWTTCTVTLTATDILITWLTTHGNPSVQKISLCQCTDVHSLALSQINPDEKALLPATGEVEELKIFEILFEGKGSERFAAASVQERAKWVSTLWEAILPSQQRKWNEAPRISDTQAPTELTVTTELPLPRPSSESPIPPSSVLSPSTFNTSPSSPGCHSERSLPPIPSKTPPPRRLGSDASPEQYLGTASPQAGLFHSLSVQSRSKSPSIANLSQSSVVKRRLAQIERTNSSVSTSPSELSTRKRQVICATPTYPSSIGKLQHHSSLRSSAGDSIISAYGDVTTPAISAPRKFRGGHESPPSPTKGAPNTWSGGSSSSAPNTPQSVEVDQRLGPFVESLECNTERQRRPTAISDQTMSSEQKFQYAHGGYLNSVLGKVQDASEFSKMQEKIDVILETLRRRSSDLDCANASSLMEILQDVRQLLGSQLPKILKILEDDHSLSAMNVAKLDSLNQAEPSRNISSDLSLVHAKLDNLLTLSGQYGASTSNGQSMENSLAIEEILTTLKSEQNQLAIQGQQQAESVRYLNELNSWLEVFVNNGTSQIETVATGVQQLGGMLGCHVDILKGQGACDTGNLLSEAQKVGDNLLTGKNTSPQNGKTQTLTEAIVSVIDRQRRDQECMIKALAEDLTNEIRGERLRFVDAMKEATSINIQAQLEQFKAQLAREVSEMNQENDLMHRQRLEQARDRGIQNDVTAFRSKPQKQTGAPMIRRIQTEGQVQQQFFRSSARPLPNPLTGGSRKQMA